jgi:hypothetical protein
MNSIFQVVYEILMFMSRISGFTYKEINIIVYFGFIPFLYFVILDKLIRKHYFKIAHLLIILSVCLFFNFTVFCDLLFKLSVDFLLLFKVIGINYIAASVLICVFLPIAIFVVLYYKYRNKKTELQ